MFYFRAGKENAITLTHYSLQDLTLNTKKTAYRLLNFSNFGTRKSF